MTVLRSTVQIVEVLRSGDPKLRSTTQVVEVLGTVDAKLRLTHQYLQVAYLPSTGAIYEKSPYNDLTLEQTVAQECIRPVSNDLSLDQTALASGVYLKSADNELTSLDQDVEVSKNLRIGNTVPMSQTVAVTIVVARSVASDQSLLSSATTIKAIGYNLANELTLSGTASYQRTLTTKVASNDLTLSGVAEAARLVSNDLILTQEASAVIGGIPKSASNELSISGTATALIVNLFDLSSALALVSGVSVGIVVEGVTNVSEALDLTQWVVATIKQNYVILQAPIPGVGAGVVLPAPELADKENSLSQMAVKRTMNGATYTYVTRSTNRLLSYTFDLAREKGLELQAFLTEFNGDLMRLQNWKGEIWEVHLMTNPVNFTQNRRHAPDGPNVGVNLQFEGVKISG